MKRNKILAIILILFVLLTTGCGSNNYIKDKSYDVIYLDEELYKVIDDCCSNNSDNTCNRNFNCQTKCNYHYTKV